jgi:hypothetical protein
MIFATQPAESEHPEQDRGAPIAALVSTFCVARLPQIGRASKRLDARLAQGSEAVNLIMLVATINARNRLAISFGTAPRSKDQDRRLTSRRGAGFNS